MATVQVHWSMFPSPALALIRPRQLLSALFTVHFHGHALQNGSVTVLTKDATAYNIPIIIIIIIFPPAKHPQHCFDFY